MLCAQPNETSHARLAVFSRGGKGREPDVGFILEDWMSIREGRSLFETLFEIGSRFQFFEKRFSVVFSCAAVSLEIWFRD